MSKVLLRFDDSDLPLWQELGAYRQAVDAALADLAGRRAAARIWARDGSLWSEEASVVAAIEDRLGWLDAPAQMLPRVPALREMAEAAHRRGFEHVLLLGMGGSSLAPEVMAGILTGPGAPMRLTVLDSTDPAQIRRARARAPLARTLVVVASKSGSTVETDTLLAYFEAELRTEIAANSWPDHVIAITDARTDLQRKALREGYRSAYTNPYDIGGRYSALSLFGLVPATLLGINVSRLLGRAREMVAACQLDDPSANPGLLLGAILGTLAGHPTRPRDKLTLLTSPELAPFGAWLEQLIAESTGKQGRGILPVEGEALGAPADYGPDRVFAYLRLAGADNARLDQFVADLVAAGQPVVAMGLRDRYDLGAEFYRWEFATAVAGQRLGINPFDQPDVEEAKVRARRALARYETTHALPEAGAVLEEGPLRIYRPCHHFASLHNCLRGFLSQAGSTGYVALLAYVGRSEENEGLLQQLRQAIARRERVAVTVGLGPRFLHSTGQLHKGGKNEGLFLLLTQDEQEDLPIPGRSYTFGTLKRAQAVGDLEALHDAGRRVMRIHLGPDVVAGLRHLLQVL